MSNSLHCFARIARNSARNQLGRICDFLSGRPPKILILTYHRVLPERKDDPLGTIMPLDVFKSQVDFLSTNYPVISLSDAAGQFKTGRVKNRVQIVLTFDDGYVDSYEVIYPYLKKKGLPAAFFLVTDYIEGTHPLWDYEISKILHDNDNISQVSIKGKIIRRRQAQSKQSFIFSVVKEIKSFKRNEREEALEVLRRDSGRQSCFDSLRDRCLGWEEIRKMCENGMEIGAHGRSHISLLNIPFECAQQEIRGSKEIIEKNTGRLCRHFSFPYGSKNDYNQPLINYAKEIGFETCLLNTHGYNYFLRDVFALKRIIMDEHMDVNWLPS